MLILVGASATGKTEIVKELVRKYGLIKMITYTTRPIRINEVNGVDYHFISKQDFLSKVENGEFVETVCYNDNYYGTLKKDVDDRKVVILEPSGLNNFYKNFSTGLVSILIETDKSIRHERMIRRGDKEENILKRLSNDDVIFNRSNMNQIDCVVQNNGNNLEEITDQIYKLYMDCLYK